MENIARGRYSGPGQVALSALAFSPTFRYLETSSSLILSYPGTGGKVDVGDVPVPREYFFPCVVVVEWRGAGEWPRPK